MPTGCWGGSLSLEDFELLQKGLVLQREVLRITRLRVCIGGLGWFGDLLIVLLLLLLATALCLLLLLLLGSLGIGVTAGPVETKLFASVRFSTFTNQR